MRRWLRAQYGSLGALNQEWGTNFTNWNLVMPLTTNQAMKAAGDNFAAWADFKELDGHLLCRRFEDGRGCDPGGRPACLREHWRRPDARLGRV